LGDEEPFELLAALTAPESPTRGVQHVHMTSLPSSMFTAELAIFANLDEDNVHF